MQRARAYVEHLKRKPAHERERIAFLSAGAVAAVVTLGYLGALVSSDRLAFESQPVEFVAEDSQQSMNSLLRAAAAFDVIDEEGDITVVESKSSSTMETPDQSSATVIPF